MSHGTLLTYPGFNETFKMRTDDRHFQLEAVISQKVKNISFYGRRLTDTKKRYTVTDKDVPILLKL